MKPLIVNWSLRSRKFMEKNNIANEEFTEIIRRK